MNQFWKEVRLAGFLGLVLPGVLLGTAASLMRTGEDAVIPMETTHATAAAPTESEAPGQKIPIMTPEGTARQMELSDYLTGVVMAEMPATFETEALKAQAVVARTYTIRAWERGGRHAGAAVCMDSTCCQGYISQEDYLAKGGTWEQIEKLRGAVADTEELVLTYGGELIEATYFSCSGGSTEDAVAVWGTDVPYLQSVSSPGEEYAAHYEDTVTFAADEFAEALALELTGKPSRWLGRVTRTEGGGVDTMVIGGIVFSGTDLRAALKLRSTAFTMTAGENSITVSTRGYGHRVGMSQYGADAMAASGSGFSEILAHYYQGAVLEQWTD